MADNLELEIEAVEETNPQKEVDDPRIERYKQQLAGSKQEFERLEAMSKDKWLKNQHYTLNHDIEYLKWKYEYYNNLNEMILNDLKS